MYPTILVPYDGSALAERALPFAVRLAREGGRLVLVQAAANVNYRLEVEEQMAILAERLWKAGIAVETHVRLGDAGEFVVEAARTWEANIVVMSTHGRSGLGRWIFGSVADYVLRHAPVPVLLVPATCDHAWPAEASRRPGDEPVRILVPLDGSALAEAALRPASDLAATLAGRLLLLRAVAPSRQPYVHAQMVPYGAAGDTLLQEGTRPVDPRSRYEWSAWTDGAELPPQTVEAIAEANEYLERVVRELGADANPVETRTYVGGAIETITSFARSEGVEAVAMATHGRGRLARVVLGSVATGVLQRIGRPLLLVRPASLHYAPSD
jgi:nucleotide-binding universal stress UspA family protein